MQEDLCKKFKFAGEYADEKGGRLNQDNYKGKEENLTLSENPEERHEIEGEKTERNVQRTNNALIAPDEI